MARTWYGRHIPDPAPPRNALDSLTAASVTLETNSPVNTTLWGGAGWQTEAWGHYDTCPELHRAASDMGEAFSRAILQVVDVDPVTGDLGDDPTDDPVAGAIGGQLFGGRTGQAQAQRHFGQHLTVAGEFYILATDETPDLDQTTWQVLSASKVSRAGNLVQIRQFDGQRRTLRDGELLFRVWQPHPDDGWLADSPTRAALPVLRELAGLSAQVIASIRSRLASAGVWLLPQSATLPPTRDEAGNELDVSPSDRWLQLLATAMMTAIANPEDPSAVVPIIAMIPDDVLDKIKDPYQFVRDVITDVQPMRDAAVKRLAIGFDAPPERLLGVGDMNHWSAWQTDESFVKGPLSSLLAVPADALTQKYLRPALRLAGKNPNLFAVSFNVDALMPDVQEKNGQEAYTSGALAKRAYLESLHFDPDRDAATPEEQAERLVLEILARGNPESLEELLPTIKRLFPGIQLTVPVTATGPTAAPPVAQTPPAGAPVQQQSTTDTRQPPALPAGPPNNTPRTPALVPPS